MPVDGRSFIHRGMLKLGERSFPPPPAKAREQDRRSGGVDAKAAIRERRERMIRRSGYRFADKIMRHCMICARSDAKPVSTFADRALSGEGSMRAGMMTAVAAAGLLASEPALAAPVSQSSTGATAMAQADPPRRAP